MFKKWSTGILIAVLAGLLIIYFAVQYFDKSDRSFKNIVLEFDPADVTEILISDPSAGEPVNLALEGATWKVVKGSERYPADSNVVKNILSQLSSLKTQTYAGKGKDAWVKYQVTDTTAIAIELKKNGKTISKLLIGKFDYSMPKDQQQQQMMMRGRQQQGDMSTYVRLEEEKEVYAVEGFLRMNFNRDADSYRDKSLIHVNKDDIQKVKIQAPDRSVELTRTGTGWLANNLPADSATTVKYINSIARLTSSTFVDKSQVAPVPSYEVEITGNNFIPVQLKAFAVADTNVNFAIQSSGNPSAYFNGKKGDLFKRIFAMDVDFTGSEAK